MSSLSTKIGNLELKNPVMVSAGTFGDGSEYSHLFDPSILGAICLKGMTLDVKTGNAPRRIVETPSGMINSIGLQNIGARSFLEKRITWCRELREKNTAVIANLAAGTIEEFIQLVELLNPYEEFSALEINVSCPNVKLGGAAFGTNESILRDLINRVRPLTIKTLVVKLTPMVTDITIMAKIAEEAGADAISLINTVPAMAINSRTRRPILSTGYGGLSGPAIKPIALRLVHLVSKSVKIPIIGMGGIQSLEDALEFFLAGASAISVGTGNFVNPMAASEIISHLDKYLEENKIDSISNLVGALEFP